jgi:hypothetical protein
LLGGEPMAGGYGWMRCRARATGMVSRIDIGVGTHTEKRVPRLRLPTNALAFAGPKRAPLGMTR